MSSSTRLLTLQYPCSLSQKKNKSQINLPALLKTLWIQLTHFLILPCRIRQFSAQTDDANFIIAYVPPPDLPKMLHMPNRLYWALGHQQSLVCNVDANPPVVDTFWTKNGHKLHFTSNRLRLLANGTVVVSHVENTDAGSYSCRPVSSLGSGPSSPLVQIIVRGGYSQIGSLSLH